MLGRRVYDTPDDRGTIRLAKTGLNWAFNRGEMMINHRRVSGVIWGTVGYSKTVRKINRRRPRGGRAPATCTPENDRNLNTCESRV